MLPVVVKGMFGATHMLMRSKLSGQQRTYLGIIESSSTQVRDVLTNVR